VSAATDVTESRFHGVRSARQFVSAYAGRIWMISLAGLLGRLLFLGYQPLWRDEAFTAVVVQRPLGQMFDAIRTDSAPPLAYLLDHLVAAVWPGPAGMRLVAALGGAAAIPNGAALGRRIAGNRGGVITAVLIAVAPAFVLSARDARMYALATTLVLAATLLLWRAVEKPSPARWVAYFGVTTLALYTDYFAILAVAAQVIAVMLVLRAGWRRTLMTVAASGVAVLMLVPWLLAARAQFAHAGDAFWVPQLGFLSVSGEFVQFFSGPPVDPWIATRPLLQTFQGFAVLAGVISAAALITFRHRLPAPGRRAALFCAVCGVGAVLLLLGLSVWRPLVDGRYASVVWGPLFPLLGAGLALIPMRLLVAALVATGATSAALSAAPNHPDTQAVIAAVEPNLSPHTLVDAYPSQYLLLLYYGDPSLLAHTRVVQDSVPWFWGTSAFLPGAIVPAVPPDVTANAGVIYYVRQPNEPDPSLPNGYRAQTTQCWTGVCVITYSRR
jgi:4-amino-4-deoxy-L-arabinose transferase-like glycosyltransferase